MQFKLLNDLIRFINIFLFIRFVVIRSNLIFLLKFIYLICFETLRCAYVRGPKFRYNQNLKSLIKPQVLNKYFCVFLSCMNENKFFTKFPE